MSRVEDIPEYRVWQGMRRRCQDKFVEAYACYGGRGIRVCERWSSFKNFLLDMGPRPSDSHQIDRIDNDGNYEPRNCRWVTAGTNSRNRRNSRILKHRGISTNMSNWAKFLRIRACTLAQRLTDGFGLDLALGYRNLRDPDSKVTAAEYREFARDVQFEKYE